MTVAYCMEINMMELLPESESTSFFYLLQNWNYVFIHIRVSYEQNVIKMMKLT